MKARTFLILIVLLAVAAAACSDGSSDADSPTQEPAPQAELTQAEVCELVRQEVKDELAQRMQTTDQQAVPSSDFERWRLERERVRAERLNRRFGDAKCIASFKDGRWAVKVGDALFSVREGSRIVVAENDVAESYLK
jgi:hypothetical protein